MEQGQGLPEVSVGLLVTSQLQADDAEAAERECLTSAIVHLAGHSQGLPVMAEGLVMAALLLVGKAEFVPRADLAGAVAALVAVGDDFPRRRPGRNRLGISNGQGRVRGKDAPVQLPQAGSRLNSELRGQDILGPPVGGDGLRLTPGPIQGQHELAVEMLPQLMACDYVP